MKYRIIFDTLLSNVTDVRDFQPMGFGQTIFFGKGKFDRWCAYTGMQDQAGALWCGMPTDKYYFELIEMMANSHGRDRVYADIKHVFEHCGKSIDRRLLDRIYQIALGYGQDFQIVYNMLLHVYYGMVAEENKEHTYLGKSIKMNGVHSLLYGGVGVDVAADECRGKPWREIQAECLKRQIYKL